MSLMQSSSVTSAKVHRRGWAMFLGGLALGGMALLLALHVVKVRRVKAAASAARAAVRSGRIEEARDLVDRWSALAPEDGEPDYDRAWLEIRANRLPDALDAMRAAVGKGYIEERLLVLRAILMVRAGKYKEALPILQAAFRDETGPAAEIADGLARCYLYGLQLGEANAVLDRWRQLTPDDARLYVWQVEVDKRLGFDDEVLVRIHREALRLDPSLDDVRLEVAEKLLKNARIDDAEQEFDILLAHQPKSVLGLVGKGRIKLLKGDIEGAIRDFEQALSENPASPHALRELAAVDLKFGRMKQARNRLEKAIEFEPEDLEIRYTYARILSALKDEDGAAEQTRIAERLRSDQKQIDILRKRLVAEPGSLDVRCEIAKWLTEHGHEQEGIDSTRYILSVDFQHPTTCRFLADYYTRKQKPGLANYYRMLLPETGGHPSDAIPD